MQLAPLPATIDRRNWGDALDLDRTGFFFRQHACDRKTVWKINLSPPLDRHVILCGMKLPIVHHPAYDVTTIPDDHRFPMRKFARLARQLVASDFADRLAWHEPEAAPVAAVERAHDPAYVADILRQRLDDKAARRIGFPITPAVANRSLLSTGGTMLAGRLALEHGAAANTAGGSHHAARGHGAGFCVFNDVAIAALDLLEANTVARVLVFDCDVHQGDGTAQIFAADPRVFTCSIHCEANWPLEKPPSDLDVGLPKDADDAAYLDVLLPALALSIDRARPDIVFYNAGVDPHASDRLGKLALTDDGLRARDLHLAQTCRRLGIPLTAVIGGGYGEDRDAVAARHLILFEAMAKTFT